MEKTTRNQPVVPFDPIKASQNGSNILQRNTFIKLTQCQQCCHAAIKQLKQETRESPTSQGPFALVEFILVI